jgi:hypothetical protein
MSVQFIMSSLDGISIYIIHYYILIKNYAGLGSLSWFLNPPGALDLATLPMKSSFNIQDVTHGRERDT